MKTDGRLFDDIAKAATGAVGALSGISRQIRSEIRSQVNRFITEMDFVPREEFEIVESMAKQARLHNEKLEKRVADLEKQLGVSSPATKSPKKTAAKKTIAPKKSTSAKKKTA